MKRKAAFSIDILATVMLIFTALGWYGERNGWFDPEPFRDVHNVRFEWAIHEGRDVLFVSADYYKTDAPCDLLPPIMVFGWAFGERTSLDYTAIRQHNQTEQRYEGKQKMKLRVRVETPMLDRVEVWARHACKGSSRHINTQMIDQDVPPKPVS